MRHVTAVRGEKKLKLKSKVTDPSCPQPPKLRGCHPGLGMGKRTIL